MLTAYRPYIILLFALLFTLFSGEITAEPYRRAGFFFEEGKRQTTFHFLSVANLIVIPVTLEANTVNLILDTGMSSIIIFHRSSLPGMKINRRNTITFSGLGSKKP